jgi:hypothetical protein
MRAQCFSYGQSLIKGEFYSLRRIVIHREKVWMVQQNGNDLLRPEVLNSLTELGQERKIGTISVDSVVHNVLAVFLYEGTVQGQKMGKCGTSSALCLSDEWAQDFDFG